jgi:membrane protein required for beta-lactamase induction
LTPAWGCPWLERQETTEDESMRRLGQFLMVLGALVGVFVALGMLTGRGFPGASWLVNVALAKLTLIGAGGLMAGGAVSVRLANRQEQRRLASRPPP